MKKQTVLSAALSLFVVFALVLASPAHAVTLSTSLPEQGRVNSAVGFSLKTDIAAEENVPVDEITLTLTSPNGQQQVCVFSPDGTPISGCDGLTITPTIGTQAYADGFGSGWNGTAVQNTSFGYGYGFEGQAETVELVWDVTWSTADLKPGAYKVNFAVSAEGPDAQAVYKQTSTSKIVLAGNPAGRK